MARSRMIILDLFKEVIENGLADANGCEFTTSFEPIFDEKTREIKSVIQLETCKSCKKQYVVQMFTDGSEAIEDLALELGFRENLLDETEEY